MFRSKWLLPQRWSFFGLLFMVVNVQGFSWGADKNARESKYPPSPAENQQILSRAANTNLRLPNMYALALDELHELESEPLCHRIAARLLVNNCQLLDRQDDATILTDSGRAARDFVDFYAASLAICDLERGSFVIPTVCSKFRETTLAGIPPSSKPVLHVTSTEIDDCLEGLGQSDSAWNTWVSYRHKALRFCEAARAENEKDQNIHLYQRVTKVLAKLTTQVEEELEARTQSIDKMLRDTTVNLESLTPQLDHLKREVSAMEAMFANEISSGAEKSAGHIKGGLEDAKSLQQLMAIMLNKVTENEVAIAESHQSALQVVTDQANDGAGLIMATLAAAVASSSRLQLDIKKSQLRAAEVTSWQKDIEEGMQRLEGLSSDLLVQHDGHQERLEKAQQTADQVLNTLHSVSSSTEAFHSSLSRGLGLTNWWPYVICPATSLVVGSYGLAPSAARNFLLISLGEIAGILVSMAQQYGPSVAERLTFDQREDLNKNATVIPSIPIYSENDFKVNSNIRQAIFTETY